MKQAKEQKAMKLAAYTKFKELLMDAPADNEVEQAVRDYIVDTLIDDEIEFISEN